MDCDWQFLNPFCGTKPSFIHNSINYFFSRFQLLFLINLQSKYLHFSTAVKKDICDDASESLFRWFGIDLFFLINLKSQTEPIYFLCFSYFSLCPKFIELSIIYRENRRKKFSRRLHFWWSISLMPYSR